jgi:hypothetical protein
MGAASRILGELTDDAVRWVESLANKLSGKPEDYVRFPTTPENVAYETGEKLVNLYRLAPQMFDIYDDRALYYALKEAKEGSADVGLINPDTFRRAAAEIPMGDPYIRDMVDQKVADLRDLRQAGVRYSDVPYLGFDNFPANSAQITAHEGRHRSRALSAEGEPYQLVRFIGPSNSPRLSQMKPNTQMLSEEISFPEGGGKQPIGTLGELIKFLSRWREHKVCSWCQESKSPRSRNQKHCQKISRRQADQSRDGADSQEEVKKCHQELQKSQRKKTQVKIKAAA